MRAPEKIVEALLGFGGDRSNRLAKFVSRLLSASSHGSKVGSRRVFPDEKKPCEPARYLTLGIDRLDSRFLFSPSRYTRIPTEAHNPASSRDLGIRRALRSRLEHNQKLGECTAFRQHCSTWLSAPDPVFGRNRKGDSRLVMSASPDSESVIRNGTRCAHGAEVLRS
jgi:hypothetical protein